MYQRGDIVSVPFPFTDLSETKLRPAIIISNELVNCTDDVIIVMITSKEKDDSFSLPIGDSNLSIPLPKASFVNCHKIVTIATSLIQKKISVASPDFINSVTMKIQVLILELNIQHGATVSVG
jgi:mRNA interferase MazF